jgi:predicted nucleic acid-binding protein
MILADSSVWIDYLRDRSSPQVDQLDILLASPDLIMADLVLAEVLQGCDTDKEFEKVRRFLEPIPVITITDEIVAIQAARHYRTLRARGITVRKTIDTLIATRCIVDGHALLYSDRDFDPFVEQLGLQSAMGQA